MCVCVFVCGFFIMEKGRKMCVCVCVCVCLFVRWVFQGKRFKVFFFKGFCGVFGASSNRACISGAE